MCIYVYGVVVRCLKRTERSERADEEGGTVISVVFRLFEFERPHGKFRRAYGSRRIRPYRFRKQYAAERSGVCSLGRIFRARTGPAGWRKIEKHRKPP